MTQDTAYPIGIGPNDIRFREAMRLARQWAWEQVTSDAGVPLADREPIAAKLAYWAVTGKFPAPDKDQPAPHPVVSVVDSAREAMQRDAFGKPRDPGIAGAAASGVDQEGIKRMQAKAAELTGEQDSADEHESFSMPFRWRQVDTGYVLTIGRFLGGYVIPAKPLSQWMAVTPVNGTTMHATKRRAQLALILHNQTPMPAG